MHELSIAMSLVDAACESAEQLDATCVHALHVRIGPLSGVVRHALEFSFGVASADTRIAGARLVIEETPLVIYCHICHEQRTLNSVQHLCCPVCNTPSPDIVQGRELELVALEIDARVPTHR